MFVWLCTRPCKCLRSSTRICMLLHVYKVYMLTNGLQQQDIIKPIMGDCTSCLHWVPTPSMLFPLLQIHVRRTKMPRPHMPEHNWKNCRKVNAHTLLIYAGFPNRKTQVQSINQGQRQNSHNQVNTLRHFQKLFLEFPLQSSQSFKRR